MMVVKLNMILITSPELSEFRKRLKSIESKVCENRMHSAEARLISFFDPFSPGWTSAVHFDIQVLVS